MTELLSPEQYGQLTLLLGIVALALGLAATPRLQAVMRYYPDWSARESVHTLRAVTVGLLVPPAAITILALTAGWATFSFLVAGPWWIGILLALMFLVDVARSFELALLNAARRQRASAIISAADAWSRPVLAVLAVLLAGSSAETALAGYVTGSAVVLALLYRFTQVEGARKRQPSQRATGQTNQKMLLASSIRKYAWPLAPLAVFGWLNGMGDRYIIAGILTVAEVGLYAAAYGLASRPFLMMAGVIELTFRPVLQNAVTTRDSALIASVKRKMLLAMTCGSVLGFLGFLLLSKFVAFLFLAPSYRIAAGMMPWIAGGYAMLTISTVYSRICYAHDATDYILKLSIVSGFVGVAALLLLASAYGLHGAVIAVPVRFAVELLLSRLYAKKAEARHSPSLLEPANAAR